jgi:hypothetical protein
MRRIKVILAVVAAVATMMVLAAPAMANDFCCNSFGSPLSFGDRFGDGDGRFLVLDEDDLEDLQDDFEDAIDDGRFFAVPIDDGNFLDSGRFVAL